MWFFRFKDVLDLCTWTHFLNPSGEVVDIDGKFTQPRSGTSGIRVHILSLIRFSNTFCLGKDIFCLRDSHEIQYTGFT